MGLLDIKIYVCLYFFITSSNGDPFVVCDLFFPKAVFYFLLCCKG